MGANLARRVLQEPDVKLTVMDSLEPALGSTMDSLSEILDKITFVQGDIRDEKILKDVVSGQDIIFNCAAQTSHPLSLKNPILDAEINCIGNLKLLNAIRDHNPQAVVVYTSSSTVIGKAVGDVVDESHGEKPLDIYSANKGVAEKYYRIYNKVYDLKTVALRFANLYGPFGKASPDFGFINYFISLAAAGMPISIYGDGLQSRNVMFAQDACDVLWLAAHEPKLVGETLFAVHQQHHTVKEVAEAIVKVFGGKVEFVPWPDFRKRIEIEKVVISGARLRKLTGWEAKVSLPEGLLLTKDIMEISNGKK